MEEQIRVRILGPVELDDGDGGLRPAGPQLRLLLALLALSPGRVVSVGDLVDALWDERPPPSARASLQILVTRLRRLLSAVAGCGLDRYGDCYQLQMSRESVDVYRFRSQVGSARLSRDNDEAIRLLSHALGLWRGPALADVVETSRVDAIRAGLAEEHLSAVQDRFERLLAVGRDVDVSAEIPLMLAMHPLSERLAGMFMTALYRCGRPADALQVFRDLRGRLTDELGVEPGAELQRLHQQILSGDPALAAPEGLQNSKDRPLVITSHGYLGNGSAPEAPSVEATPRNGELRTPSANAKAGHETVYLTAPFVPRQLRAAPASFAGRERELSALTELLEAGPGGPAIAVISGTPGVGKTALALRWAHQAQHRFPDGQLYVNLGGFDASPSPVTPADAIAGFLESLGVADSQIPARTDAQAALYRSLLADRRMLVVLDNARDEAQVRPLLPGSATCMALVTSRSELAGLIVAEGACAFGLDVLNEAEARQLLAGRLGAGRVAAEADAVAELTSLCGHLPLALAIAAARAATRPSLPLATLAKELQSTRHRLDGLDVGNDETTNLKAVFSWSYRLLSQSAAQIFRLLGAHPGPDISAAAAASLAATSAATARAALGELTSASLAEEQAPGRFTLHDLVRAYAAQLSDQPAHQSALRRTLDYYLHNAYTAARLVYPGVREMAIALAGSHAAPEEFATAAQARAWLQAEHQVLLAAIATAADSGFDEHAWQLAAVLHEYLSTHGHYLDWVSSQQTALAAARRLRDDAAQAFALRNLGDALIQLGSWGDARRLLLDALTLYGQLGNREGAADCHCSIACLSELQEDYAEGLSHARHALRLHRAIDNLSGQAAALNGVGWFNALLGNNELALTRCKEALELHRNAGNRLGEAKALDSLGYCCVQTGRNGEAVIFYRQALEAYTEIDERFHRAHTLIRLGDTYQASGNSSAAHDTWQQAAEILDDLHHPDAQAVRAKFEGATAAASA